MAVRLDQVNVVSADVPATLAFYQLLGVEFPEMPAEWAGWEFHHRAAEDQPTDFEVDSRAFASAYWASEELPSGAMLTFRTDTRDEVDALYERMTAAGHRGVKPPFDAAWGARFAIVLGPSGEGVGLMSPSDPRQASPHPDPATFG